MILLLIWGWQNDDQRSVRPIELLRFNPGLERMCGGFGRDSGKNERGEGMNQPTYIIDFHDRFGKPILGSDGSFVTRLKSRVAIVKAIREHLTHNPQAANIRHARIYHFEHRYLPNAQPKEIIWL